MKDQYVADINDYVKYSLLRRIQAVRDGALLVCWMRTPGDARGDGRLVGYLSQPDRYRAVDRTLFDELATLVHADQRRLSHIEQRGIIPRAEYYSAVLEDDAARRLAYIDGLYAVARHHDLVFFDPDNGLDVPSVSRGRAGSSRYLYTDELSRLQLSSAIVYQHFPRRERGGYLRERLEAMAVLLPQHHHFAVYSSRVAYLFAVLPDSVHALRAGAVATVEAWAGALRLADL